MFTLIMMSPPLPPTATPPFPSLLLPSSSPPSLFPLHPSLRAQAVSGAGRPLQEPAGRAFAPEPAGVGRAALLRAPQPGEDAAGHGDADGAARLELALPRLGARRALLQVPQRAFGGVHFSRVYDVWARHMF